MSAPVNYKIEFVKRTKEILEENFQFFQEKDREVTFLLNCLLGLIVTISENEKRKNNVFRGAIDPDFLNLIPEKIGFIEKNKGWYNEKCVKVEGVLVSLQVTKPKRKSHDSQNPSYANQTRRSSQSGALKSC